MDNQLTEKENAWKIVGHDWAVQLLQHQIADETVRHAYLISGPPGCGKETLALRFAQALNCSQPHSPGMACGICRACIQIDKRQHPDLAVLERDPEKTQISIEQIRTLEHSLSLAPYEANWRVALILNAAEASREAQNALLKTLEEAPEKVVLILTADSPEALLPTIASRCEILRLRPLPIDSLAGLLSRDMNLESEKVSVVAHLSQGCYGRAMTMLKTPEILSQHSGWIEDGLRLIFASRVERFSYAERISREHGRDSLRQVIRVWITLWRDICLVQKNVTDSLINLGQLKEIQNIARKIFNKGACEVALSLEGELEKLDANVNPRLLIEVLLLNWPFLK